MNKRYEPINQYNKLFNNNKIKKIDKLIESQSLISLFDDRDSLVEKSQTAIKNFMHNDWIKVKNGQMVKRFKVANEWGFIDYETISGERHNLWLNNFICDSKINDNKYAINDIKNNIDDNSRFILSKLYELNNCMPKGTLLKTRKRIGLVNKTLYNFFSCPCRTGIGSQLNLIIETSAYGISYRFPALHYWNMQSYREKRLYLPYKKLDLLKIMYYKEIMGALKEHIKVSDEKRIQLETKLEEIKKDLGKYLVASEI